MDIISARLKSLREGAEKTQQDISVLLGSTQQQYSLYETNKNDIPLRHLLTLASFYDVSTDYILGRVPYPRLPPEFSSPLYKNVTIGDFVCRINAYNNTSRKLLLDYSRYLSLREIMEKKNREKRNQKEAGQNRPDGTGKK